MTLAQDTIPIISSIKNLGANYAAWLVDIWGVMHNGVSAYPSAVEATRAFRQQGGIVVLLSNSPRPGPAVRQQLDAVGVPSDAYDATVTSGDLTHHELGKHQGAAVFHLGPERDRPIFAGLDLTLVPADSAELVVCSGLFDDETETPDDYAELLGELAERDLPMICANPDHMVERGGHLIYCAGALAAVYEEIGGGVIYAGKPYAPIYDLALETIAAIAGRLVARSDVLAVGDGLNTDMQGATEFGVDAVFVASGLHVERSDAANADSLRLSELFAGRKPPVAAMRALVW